MNRNETADVLTAIASYDLRTVGEPDVVSWHAAIGELDKGLALEAVVVHHKTNTDRIKPAHVLGIAKSIRRDRAERESADDRREREDWRDARMGLAAPDPALGNLPIGGADGTPVPMAYQVNDALKRKCPRCESEIGQTCWNPITGKDRKIPCLARTRRAA